MIEQYTLWEIYENNKQEFESFTDFLLAEVERLRDIIANVDNYLDDDEESIMLGGFEAMRNKIMRLLEGDE
tara:strand:- start:32882 stop:33094 length:213 start_codon:yes stop_codon:yes gene_type:complete